MSSQQAGRPVTDMLDRLVTGEWRPDSSRGPWVYVADVRETLREDETVRRITDSGDVQQVFDWYLNGGEHQRSVDDWCETCSTPEGPVYHDPWPETSESDVVRAVLTVLAGDDQ